MNPRSIFTFAVAFLSVALSASAQTAHDYFNELKAANALNHYKDEYVCFRDDDVPTFVVLAKVNEVIEDMKKAGDTAGVKATAPAKQNSVAAIRIRMASGNGT